MKKLAVATAILMAGMSSLAYAETSFEDWHVDNVDGRCTAWTKPTASQGEQRTAAVLSIVNVPSEGVKNSVAFSFGRGGAGKAQASATIDGKTFELLTFNDAAFAASGQPEGELIAAMKKGGQVDVNWSEQDGSISRDSYSLKGFTAAQAQINKDCR